MNNILFKRFSSNILFFYFGFSSIRSRPTVFYVCCRKKFVIRIISYFTYLLTYLHVYITYLLHENICHSMKNWFTVHQNYVAADQERNPLFLSVVTSEVSDQSVPHYRVILWRKTVSIRLYLYVPLRQLLQLVRYFSIRNER